MRKKIFIVAFLCCILGLDGMALSAKKKGKVARVGSAQKRSTKTVSPSVKKNISWEDVSVSDDVGALTCGVMANKNNMAAKKICALAMADALKTYCEKNSCSSKLKVEYSFNFALSDLSKISASVDGNSCGGENLERFCLSFKSELLDGLWDLYSEKNIRDRKNCNIAKAKYQSAQNCFQYITAEKNLNSNVGSMFSETKLSELDNKIDEICGKDAIINVYNNISFDELSDADKEMYFSLDSAGEKGIASKKKKLSSDVATLFANVGDNSWNLMGQIGKIADLRLADSKSQTYPREVAEIANTFVTKGEAVCGKDFVSDMVDTSFEIKDNRSSLEKAISKKGILKGSFDFVIDNTVGAVSDEAAEHLKQKGIVGSIQEAIDKKNKEKEERDFYPEAEKDYKTLTGLLKSCDGETKPSNFSEIKNILARIGKALKEIDSPENEKYKKQLFINNAVNIAKNLNEILKFNRKPKLQLNDDLGNEFTAFKYECFNDESSTEFDSKCPVRYSFPFVERVWKTLNEATDFNCPGVPFVEDKVLNWTFNYQSKSDLSADDINNMAKGLLESLKDVIDEFDSINEEEKKIYDATSFEGVVRVIDGLKTNLEDSLS